MFKEFTKCGSIRWMDLIMFLSTKHLEMFLSTKGKNCLVVYNKAGRYYHNRSAGLLNDDGQDHWVDIVEAPRTHKTRCT